MPYRQVDLPQFLAALKAAGARVTRRQLNAWTRTVKWFSHVSGEPKFIGMVLVMYDPQPIPTYLLWYDDPVLDTLSEG
jgi:hypothetical protein